MNRTEWAEIIEGAIAVIGLGVLWRCWLSREARARWGTYRLAPWTANPADFMTVLLLVIGVWFVSGVGVTLGLRATHFTNDQKLILQSAASELGLLAGVVAFTIFFPGRFEFPRIQVRKSLVSGLATFLIAMPVIFLAGAVWTNLLKLCGLPVEKQPAIELFARMNDIRWLGAFVVVAVVMAPLAEELIFRACLFRFFRTRIPRWLAFLAPALLFAALHQNLASLGQLIALAVVFSYAYERTGQIGTSMVAHALFNLNTVVLLLLGIDL